MLSKPKFLLDSSVVIRWMRQGQNPTAILRPYTLYRQSYTCGVVQAEVLRGAKFPGIKEETWTLFGTMVNVDTIPKLWGDVAEIAWLLDRRGTRIPLTDIVIAACALEAEIPIVTFDRDFDAVPGLTTYSELP